LRILFGRRKLHAQDLCSVNEPSAIPRHPIRIRDNGQQPFLHIDH
jgi:hypothetical protein